MVIRIAGGAHEARPDDGQVLLTALRTRQIPVSVTLRRAAD